VVIVDLQLFLDAMRVKWSEYNNTHSGKLDLIWLQIVTTLNYQASPEGEARWPVIPAELGIGKTTCAKLWCSMLPRGISALVVVRTREQAREFANDVNAWAGDRRAVALFSPSDIFPNEFWGSPRRTRGYQVVVVCHKSYEMGLDEYALDAAHARFEVVHQFQEEGKRDVVIIDEALDQVAEARITRGALHEVIGVVQSMTQFRRTDRHLEAQRVLDSADRALREAPTDRHQALAASELLALTDYTVDQATDYLDQLWKDVRTSSRVQPDARAFTIGVLDVLRRHLNTLPWTNSKWASSARLLRTPPNVRGVVLDATGQLNSVYQGRPVEFEVRSVAPVRDYSAVTVFEARTRWTGKLRVAQHAREVAQASARDLMAHYGGSIGARHLLVVMAKDTSKNQEARGAFERAFADAGFAEVAITNWGRVEGRNDWKAFDTLLLASLYYGSNTQDVNAYLAIADVAPDENTLNAVDEVKLVRQRRIAAGIAQAIGRLRLRTMTTEDGKCAPCDVWVRLPNTNIVIDVDQVMDAVTATLPGAVRKPWASGSRRAPRPGSIRRRQRLDTRIVGYLGGLPSGTRIEADRVREALGAKTSTWGRALQRLAAAPPPGWVVQRPAVPGLGRATYLELLPVQERAPTAL
jgi:hypothetical protein